MTTMEIDLGIDKPLAGGDCWYGKWGPMRAVVSREQEDERTHWETLECGHVLRCGSGTPKAKRRHCSACAPEPRYTVVYR